MAIAPKNFSLNDMTDAQLLDHPRVAALVGKHIAEERIRVSSILSSPEAKGREALALHIIAHTHLDAGAAKALLGASPKASPAHDLLREALAGDINIQSLSPAHADPMPADAKTRRKSELKANAMNLNVARGYITAEEANARLQNLGGAR